MKDKEKICLDEFDDYRCQRPEKHRGKHRDDSDNNFVMWTNAGKERLLRERAQEATPKEKGN